MLVVFTRSLQVRTLFRIALWRCALAARSGVHAVRQFRNAPKQDQPVNHGAVIILYCGLLNSADNVLKPSGVRLIVSRNVLPPAVRQRQPCYVVS
jgi:hypothetical protein